ncbi:hypothetical protein DFP72DRAFT_1094466 [Ephemerocybe angulata]|uniref:Uncharacterized protein n=1 Tax=Ephemerocybe angulata TaxID=980116 RepID=A0A8H6IA74_9AGAR|nr:hypothetical protein DFP72DRAFT_1094466 [Tulosesus angulatus]
MHDPVVDDTWVDTHAESYGQTVQSFAITDNWEDGEEAKVMDVPAPPPLPAEVHPQQGIFLLYIVTAWLHLQFHLPFRACNALLNVMFLIIRSFGVVIAQPEPLITLNRVLTSTSSSSSSSSIPMSRSISLRMFDMCARRVLSHVAM